MNKLKKILAAICALALLSGSTLALTPAFAESETVEEKHEEKPAATPKPEAKSEEKSEAKPESKSEEKAETKSEEKSEAKSEEKSEEKSEPKSEEKSEAKSEEKAEPTATAAEATKTPEETKPAEDASDDTVTPAPSESLAPTEGPEDPTAEPTEGEGDTEAPDETVDPTATPEIQPLKASVSSEDKFGIVDNRAINFSIAVTGGVAPYAVKITIEREGREVFSSDVLVNVVSYLPTRTGDFTLKLSVTDAEGREANAKCTVPAATSKKDSIATWIRKVPGRRKGQTMAEHLADVARSQVGYKESEFNFIVDDEGKKQGYSVYGGWYGLPYEEWCAMFASFCLKYAGISAGDVPRESNCNRWKDALWTMYIDDEDEYLPRVGDLIFFHHDRVSTDPNFPNHVGIVVDVNREQGLVYTVEGNAGKAVREKVYSMDDETIVGYVNIAAATAYMDVAHAQADKAAERTDIPQQKRLARIGAEIR